MLPRIQVELSEVPYQGSLYYVIYVDEHWKIMIAH